MLPKPAKIKEYSKWSIWREVDSLKNTEKRRKFSEESQMKTTQPDGCEITDSGVRIDREDTPEHTVSSLQSEKFQAVKEPSGKGQFRLAYLPRSMTANEVIKKLSSFGTVVDFRFCPLTFEEIQKDERESSNFKCAEFKYKEETSTENFSAVKRIRIKGLQVRIIQILPKSNKKSKGSPPSIQILHSCRPTAAQYFQLRRTLKCTLPQSTEDNYYWRV